MAEHVGTSPEHVDLTDGAPRSLMFGSLAIRDSRWRTLNADDLRAILGAAIVLAILGTAIYDVIHYLL